MNKIVSLLSALFLLVACKTDRVSEPYKSDLHLPEDLSDFTSKMSERDTIKIVADLTMEWWVRRDEITITKKNDKVRLHTTIKEDTTFEMKYEMRINELPTVILNKPNNNFEKHFLNRLERTKDETERQYIYKVMMPNDTLIFYIDGLGDKGGEVREYYEFMRNYYPNEKEFTFPEVEIEEVDDISF